MADELSQSDIEKLLGELATDDASGSAGSDDGSSTARQAWGAETGGKNGALQLQGKVILPVAKRRMAAIKGLQSVSGYEVYDFRRSDRLSKEQVRSLQIIHDNFAQIYASTLSSYLRAQVTVETTSIEQVQYQEYVHAVDASLINILDVELLKGQMLLDFDLRLMFSMFDRLLGGPGEATLKVGKDLTDVEKVLTQSICARALHDLKSAWSTALPIDFAVSSVETNLQFVQMIPNTDTLILVLFNIKIGKQQGTLCLGIPYLSLKPFTSRLSVQRWAASSKPLSMGLAPKMATRLRENTPLACIARLGTSSISVDTITSLQVGEILPLKIAQGNGDDSVAEGGLAAVDLIIGGRPKFHGQIGLRGAKLAVQIEGAIAPPQLLEIHKEKSLSQVQA